MRALLLTGIIVLSTVARAEGDAPVAETRVTVEVCQTESDAILLGKYVKRIEAENESLKKDVDLPIWIPIVIGVVALGIGAGVGATVATAVEKSKK